LSNLIGPWVQHFQFVKISCKYAMHGYRFVKKSTSLWLYLHRYKCVLKLQRLVPAKTCVKPSVPASTLELACTGLHFERVNTSSACSCFRHKWPPRWCL